MQISISVVANEALQQDMHVLPLVVQVSSPSVRAVEKVDKVNKKCHLLLPAQVHTLIQLHRSRLGKVARISGKDCRQGGMPPPEHDYLV